MVIFFIGVGLVAEIVFKRFVTSRYFPKEIDGRITLEAEQYTLGTFGKLSSTLIKVIPDTIGLILFFAVSYFCYFTFIWTTSPFLQLAFLAALLTITLIRILNIFSQVVFSPAILDFRILPIQCETANNLHRMLVWTGGYMIMSMMFSVVTFKLGAQLETFNILRIFFATAILVVTAAAALVYKDTIKNQILNASGDTPVWGRQKFASVWHILAVFYLFLLWFLLINTIETSPEALSRGAFFISFFVVPIWLVLDRLVQWVVQYSIKALKIYDESTEDIVSPEDIDQQEKGKFFLQRSRAIARFCLFISLSIWIASLWGITFPFLSKFTAVFFDATVILFITLLFWQFISSWIENKIAESLPEDEEEDKEDDEWGGAANRGRSYTLLPMIRKFIGSVLVVMVTMTVLSSMGVDIGPLLAGAGVIGLALGFGAQKLVADIFSGFFYLLDDAFRVGEYLEAGQVGGTVENITLRNVMLRHHRGMLQIVPHSDLGAITNFMRGGIVVKFNLDFPYDANIDKIRKVIKKVGQAMLQDEELGKDFIRPVKSQGVREISNSVMTIRVKFTAQPGAHFVIRREAYKRITEALNAQNIHYAHRKVIVDLPVQNGDKLTEDQKGAAGAAAAQAIEDIVPKDPHKDNV